MANKAFAFIDRMRSGEAQPSGGMHFIYVASTTSVILNEDDQVLGYTSSEVQAGYHDSSQSIHQKLADQIRIDSNYPDLIVVFLDSPGRY